MNEYVYMQGEISAAQRDSNGKAIAFRSLGNCPAFSLKLGQSAAANARTTSTDPVAVRAGRMRRGTSASPTFDITLESASVDNIALALYSSVESKNAATVNAEPHVAYRGFSVALDNINISTVVQVRNANYNIVYTPGVDYIVDLKHGSLYIPETSNITDGLAITVNYDFVKYTVIRGFTTVPPPMWLRFEGIDISRGGLYVVDIFKAVFDPLDSLQLMGGDLLNLSLTGRMLNDYRDATDTTLSTVVQIRKV